MGANCSVVPSADVKLNTQALMARYSFNDKYSVIAGVRQSSLRKSSLDTLAAAYSIDAVSKTGAVYGFAYERPDIALKFEILRSESITIDLVGKAATSPGCYRNPCNSGSNNHQFSNGDCGKHSSNSVRS